MKNLDTIQEEYFYATAEKHPEDLPLDNIEPEPDPRIPWATREKLFWDFPCHFWKDVCEIKQVKNKEEIRMKNLDTIPLDTIKQEMSDLIDEAFAAGRLDVILEEQPSKQTAKDEKWMQKEIEAQQAFTAAEQRANSLSFEDWRKFISLLDNTGLRNGLVTRCILYKEIEPARVRHVKIADIDFSKNTIRYRNQNRHGVYKDSDTVITYPKCFMNELQRLVSCAEIVENPLGFVFITKGGNPVETSCFRPMWDVITTKIGMERITHNLLHTSWVQFKEDGISDEDIMR